LRNLTVAEGPRNAGHGALAHQVIGTSTPRTGAPDFPEQVGGQLTVRFATSITDVAHLYTCRVPRARRRESRNHDMSFDFRRINAEPWGGRAAAPGRAHQVLEDRIEQVDRTIMFPCTVRPPVLPDHQRTDA